MAVSSTPEESRDEVVRPSKLAHVVLRANDFDKMHDYWTKFLNAKTAYLKPGVLGLLSYDDEHHRIGLVGVQEPHPQQSSLMHVAFTFDSLHDLLAAYRLRRARYGIEPYWCVNHGPTMSLYYRDPEGNGIETQFDTMTTDEAFAFMETPEFDENPVGVDFDPDSLIQRLAAGESEAEICKRANIGPRAVPTAS